MLLSLPLNLESSLVLFMKIIKYWKVFEEDLEIRKFLESVDEFSALHTNQDHDS
jgi:hypothetical protein